MALAEAFCSPAPYSSMAACMPRLLSTWYNKDAGKPRAITVRSCACANLKTPLRESSRGAMNCTPISIHPFISSFALLNAGSCSRPGCDCRTAERPTLNSKGNAILAVAGGNGTCRGFYYVRRVPHGDSPAYRTQHLDIVVVIAKGHYLLKGYAKVLCQRLYGAGFRAARVHDA